MLRYKCLYVLQTNCWFLPSQLQEYLGTKNGGSFDIGSQMHSGLAPDDRVRIAQRLASFDARSPSSPQAQYSHPLLRAKSLETISVKATLSSLQNIAAVPRAEKSLRRQRSSTDPSNGTGLEVVGQQPVHDVDEILRRFQKMDHNIRTLCDAFAEHVDRLRESPVNEGPPGAVPNGCPLAELAGDSVTVEDYAYFTTLFIINREIYNGIFLPIHPAAVENKARPYGRQLNSGEYAILVACWYPRRLKLYLLVPPADAMIVRAQLFQGADPKISVDRGSECIRATIKTIQTEILGAMRGLGSVDEESPFFPSSFTTNLQQIVQSAYEWNRIIKQSIGKYAFTPFLVDPLTEWNLERMESFERLRRMQVPTGSKIIYPVSLGIMGSRSVGEDRPRILYVQRKAQVLVKEWFRKSSTPKLATALPFQVPPVRPTSPLPSARSSRGIARASGTTTTITITAPAPPDTRKIKPRGSIPLLRSMR